MPNRQNILRIAVVQIEAHPAAYISFSTLLEEPFLSRETSLARLGQQGFSVASLQEACLERYVEWHAARLDSIMRFLMQLAPVPDVVLFPEYSIPWQCLKRLQAALVGTATVLFAGTHTVQSLSQAIQQYRDVGIDDKRARKFAQRKATSALPVLTATTARLIPKHSTSPCECTDVTDLHAPAPKLVPLPLETEHVSTAILPLICSDALQTHRTKGGYSVAVLVSCQDKPDYFSSFIETQVRQHHPVAYANDGLYGGSGVFTATDSRAVHWQQAILPELPARNDGIIVVDIDLATTAVQVGTSEPGKPGQLIRLASITYQGTQANAISHALEEGRAIEDSESRARYLLQYLSSGKCTDLQAARIDHLATLAKRGIDGADWWDAIGHDCTVTTLPLRELEASLASLCQSELQQSLSRASDINPEGAKSLVDFLSHCQRLVQASPGLPVQAAPISESPALGVIDREDETRNIVGFIDHHRLRVCFVLGREQIGKSTVLQKALAVSAIPRETLRIIRVSDTSTAEYVLACIVFGKEPAPGPQAYELSALLEKLPNAIKTYRLLVIEDGHNLLRGDQFRNQDLQVACQRIFRSASDAGCKIIVLSRRAFPDEFTDAPSTTKYWIRGFENEALSHGLSYLDSQLRRNGLAAADIPEHAKSEIVQILGGHPVALALAADNIFLWGISEVAEQLRSRGGFWKSYVDRLLSSLEVTRDDHEVLQLLSGCQTPIAREVIQQCAAGSIAPSIKSLVSLCLVDITPDGCLWLSGLLRAHWPFSELSQEKQRLLHTKAAAWYQRIANEKRDLQALVEAEYHAKLAGIEVSVHSGLLDGQLGSAWAMYQNQEYIRAKVIVDSALRVKMNRDILRLSALVDCRLNGFDVALVKVRHVLSEDPNDTWFFDEIARAALDLDRTDVFSDLLAIADATGVEDYRISYAKGRLYLRQRRLPEAASCFEKAKNLTRTDAWPYFHLGRAHMRLGEPERAAEALEEGLEFYESHCRKNARLANAMRGLLMQCYVLEGEREAATRLYELLDEQDQSTPEIARAAAMLAIGKEGIQQAADAYQRLRPDLLQKREDRCQFHLYYGIFLAGVGSLADACEQFSHAHSAVSTNVYVLVKWADTLYQLAEKTSEDASWADQEGSVLAHAKKCAEIVRKVFGLSPKNQKAISLQENLFHRFKIQA